MAYLVVNDLNEFGSAEEFNKICLRVGWGRRDNPFDYFVEQLRAFRRNSAPSFIFPTLPQNLVFPCFRSVSAVIELHDPLMVKIYHFLLDRNFEKPWSLLREEQFRQHFVVEKITHCIELGKKLRRTRTDPFASRPYHFLNDLGAEFKRQFIYDDLVANYHSAVSAQLTEVIYEDVLFARIVWILANCYAREPHEIEKSKFNGKIPYVVTKAGKEYYKGHKISIYGAILNYLMENGGDVGGRGIMIDDYIINEMLDATRKFGGFFAKTSGGDIISSLTEMLFKDNYVIARK